MPIGADAKYLAAQNEMSTRIQSRDIVMVTFTSLTSALVGFAVSNSQMSFVAVGVGYMSLASSLVYFQHELAIACLAEFQRDLGSYLEKSDGGNDKSPNWWDGRYRKDRSKFRQFRIIGYLLIITLGNIASLWIARKGLGIAPIPNYEMKVVAWWGSLGCFICAFILIIWAIVRRKNLYAKT